MLTLTDSARSEGRAGRRPAAQQARRLIALWAYSPPHRKIHQHVLSNLPARLLPLDTGTVYYKVEVQEARHAGAQCVATVHMAMLPADMFVPTYIAQRPARLAKPPAPKLPAPAGVVLMSALLAAAAVKAADRAAEASEAAAIAATTAAEAAKEAAAAAAAAVAAPAAAPPPAGMAQPGGGAGDGAGSGSGKVDSRGRGGKREGGGEGAEGDGGLPPGAAVGGLNSLATMSAAGALPHSPSRASRGQHATPGRGASEDEASPELEEKEAATLAGMEEGYGSREECSRFRGGPWPRQRGR